jgi:hypothetical protein
MGKLSLEQLSQEQMLQNHGEHPNFNDQYWFEIKAEYFIIFEQRCI